MIHRTLSPRPATDEVVIVVPAALLRALGSQSGFDDEPRRILDAIFQPGAARGMARSLAEVDPTYRQLIGYVILRHGDEVFHYQRGPGGGEARLAGRRSVGLGGHLNVGDVADRIDRASLERSIRRELDEEVELDPVSELSFVGVLNDDESDVGRVHLGIVVVVNVASTRVWLRDPSLANGRFDPIASLLPGSEQFESWSALSFPWLSVDS
jgi:predicted NUDIX family phosphoesterase